MHAGIFRREGKYDEALDLARQALEMRLRAFGEQHPIVAVGRLRIAQTLLLSGEREDGLAELCRCIEARGAGFGASVADVRAARVLLAEQLLEGGDTAGARAAAVQALEELDPEADREAVERARRVLGS